MGCDEANVSLQFSKRKEHWLHEVELIVIITFTTAVVVKTSSINDCHLPVTCYVLPGASRITGS